MKIIIALAGGVIAVIYALSNVTDVQTVAQFVTSPASKTDTSFEEQLLAGADPTELLEATAAGAEKPSPLNCDDVLFGRAKEDLFVRRYGGDLYVVQKQGFKAFQLDESGYFGDQVAFNHEARQLQDAYQRCEKPNSVYSVNISLNVN